MRTTLYYFTGTGNSLACARAIAAGLGDADLVPISSLRGEERVRVLTERVGIVCPVYFYTLPLIVREFIPRLDLSGVRYAFLVATMGGLPGLAVLHGEELFKKAGGDLHAGFAVRMFANYIAEYNVRGEGAVRAMGRRMERRVKEIVPTVQAERCHLERGWPFDRLLSRAMFALLGRKFVETARTRDRLFTADPSCNRCGTCARVCPVENVRLVEGRPEWLGHCEQCFACIHFCPVAAIQIRGKRTRLRGRYHHPDVTVEDIAGQRRVS
ncbi:TPA: 4Fe-4S ferredoxin [Candidatus Acetothermia bacterium]|nr:4Fe-4S ferredoxin [Candidatus Acetothermia bacterium]